MLHYKLWYNTTRSILVNTDAGLAVAGYFDPPADPRLLLFQQPVGIRNGMAVSIFEFQRGSIAFHQKVQPALTKIIL